jgi:hypothetical protein
LISGLSGYFRRPLKYNYRRVDCENLWLYLKEFEFRFNRRRRSEETFWDLVGAFPACTDQSVRQLRDHYMRANPARGED